MISDGTIIFAVAAVNDFGWIYHIGNISKVYLGIYVLLETHHLHYNIKSFHIAVFWCFGGIF
jgi:hypothetical protein